MTYGPDGMWYRAASYDTQEQCLAFLGRVKPLLAARNGGDDLVTISFGTPEGRRYVMALGYPVPETIALVESLFEGPPVTLSKDEITYARLEVTKLRQRAGVSDTQAAAQALGRLRNMGVPEPAAQTIAKDYTKHLLEGSSPVSEPVAGGTPSRPGKKDLSRERARPFFVRFRSHIDEITREELVGPSIAVYKEQLRAMTAYLFTASAMKLFHAVHEPHKQNLPIPGNDVFLEFPSPLDTPHGIIRAFVLTRVNNPVAVAEVERKNPGLKGLSQREGFSGHMLYRLQAIDDAMQIIATENYDGDLARWVHAYECPTGTCVIERQAGEEKIIQPCDTCVARTAFWGAWIRSLLLIVDHEYAITPEPAPWEVRAVSYEEEASQKVGKGKNTRVIKAIHKREIEYRIISFDVSLPAHRAARTPQDAQADEEKRANWLMRTPKDQIIYKRMAFDDIERHYTHHARLLAKCEQTGGKFTEKDGEVLREYRLETHPDGTKAVVSKLVPFEKYVPMLREKKTTIRKVIASAYEGKE